MEKTGRTVLLVEDNPDDEMLTLRALKSHHLNHAIDVVHDGAEALEYLLCTGAYAGRDPSLLPQLVLLDLNLPKVGGLEVLQRIRAEPRLRCLPVVVLTSSDEERDVVESYSRGANSYVRKPVQFAEFIDGVSQLGIYWMMINQAPPGAAS